MVYLEPLNLCYLYCIVRYIIVIIIIAIVIDNVLDIKALDFTTARHYTLSVG